MSRIYYIANARIPTQKAHGLQIIHTCQALATHGHEVVLLVPSRFSTNPDADLPVAKFYDLDISFEICPLSVWDTHVATWLPNWLIFYLLELQLVIQAKRYIGKKTGYIFTRSKLVCLFFAHLSWSVWYEAHDSVKPGSLDRWVSKSAKQVVAIAPAIERSWSQAGAETVYAPDGLPESWCRPLAQSSARSRLGLENSSPLIVHTGTLVDWKGAATIVKAATDFSQKWSWFQVGRIDYPQTGALKLVGHQSHSQVRWWQAAADVLVIANSAGFLKGQHDTSPLKLYEYLASGRPVVASRVPALTEVVPETLVTWFEPDDADSLVQAIARVLTNPKESAAKAKQAQRFAAQFTWKQRAKLIGNSMDTPKADLSNQTRA